MHARWLIFAALLIEKAVPLTAFDGGWQYEAYKHNLPVRGLPNIGNSCYMNASLQCLFRVPEIVSLAVTAPQKEVLLSQCGDVVGAYICGDNEKICIGVTRLFELVNAQLFESDDQNCQQDALEFLGRLIKRSSLLEPLFRFSMKISICCEQCNKVLRSAYQTAYELPPDFFISPSVDGMACPNCLRSISRKKITLTSCPLCLLVDCERVGRQYFSATEKCYRELPGYELVGAVLYSGTKQEGHYIASVREHSSDVWYLCDDENILPLHCGWPIGPLVVTAKNGKNIAFFPRFLLYVRLTQGQIVSSDK